LRPQDSQPSTIDDLPRAEEPENREARKVQYDFKRRGFAPTMSDCHAVAGLCNAYGTNNTEDLPMLPV
jgi:hypothetical protein